MSLYHRAMIVMKGGDNDDNDSELSDGHDENAAERRFKISEQVLEEPPQHWLELRWIYP